MSRTSSRGRMLLRLATAGFAVAVLGVPAPAYAAEGSIDHVEQSDDGTLLLLYSVPGGAAPDLDTVSVSIGGTTLPATAESASGAGETVRRTAVLAMDVSNSMEGERFEAAKGAAVTFLESAPEDLNIGLVTFAGDVETVVEPTTDHDALEEAIGALELSQGTRLYEGVARAVAATGKVGARSVLVLSDGADSTQTEISTALEGIRAGTQGDNKVKVDVVGIEQNAADRAKLAQMASEGGGTVLDAGAPDQIDALFAGEAAAIAQQVLVSATPPDDLRGTEGEVTVSLNAGGEIYSDATFVSLDEAPAAAPRPPKLEATDTGFQLSENTMWLGLGAAAVAGMVLIVAAFGGARQPKQDAVSASIEAYTRQGAKKLAAAAATADTSPSLTQQAVGAAAKVLESNKGIESALGARIEAAGMQIKPAEWLLMHAGITIAGGVVGLLLGGGNVLWMLLGLVIGGIGPYLFLGRKRTRRVKAFKAQLADTLQLMAGSLSAGLSLAQSVDTVVREGTDPMGAEFRRALVEMRLGVDIDHALSGIAERMESKDFEWIVMAIRIQREVGGNLAELLTKVAETIREREYLERQVLTLSAEGRLSVWILGGLPPAFLLYLVVANPTYLEPLFTEPIGFVLLGVMAVLECVGVLWMKKLVKVDV